MINDEQAAVCFGHLPPPPQPSRVASSSRDEAVFILKNTDYWDHSVTTAFHSIIPSLSQNYACLSYFLTGGGIIHKPGIYGSLVFTYSA